MTELGEEPKLFVASEGEGMAEEVRRMAEKAPGHQNEALILPGDAHAQAIFRTGEGDRLMRASWRGWRRVGSMAISGDEKGGCRVGPSTGRP